MEGCKVMSFLEPLLASAGPALSAAGAAGGGANAAASGLGHLIGVDPSRISSIAGTIGKGMNGIAAGGGASPGYADPGLPDVNNHMQLLDPAILQAIIQHFQGGGGLSGGTGVRPVSY
jgi:hypothetical protein